MDSAQAAHALEHHLMGTAFCKADDLGLNHDEIKICDEFVKGAGVKGFQYIFKLVGQYAQDVCTDTFEVCQQKRLF